MPSSVKAVAGEDADRALMYLGELSPGMRGGVILGEHGSVIAASGDPQRWGRAAARLLEAADRAGPDPAEHVHVATADGEVFAVRHGGLAAVAVTDRFVLASLMVFDMRAVLRELAGPRSVEGE